MSETNWTANWVRSSPITNDPAGYVIAGMRRDPNVPPLFHHIGEMRSYLRLKGAPIEALAAVPSLWQRYSYWLAQTRRRDARKARQEEGSPLVLVMVNGIGRNLTNDEKRAHLADLGRAHLIDQVCIQEILPPEK